MVQPTPPADGGAPSYPIYPTYDGGQPYDPSGAAPWTTQWPAPGETFAPQVPPAPPRTPRTRGPLVLALVALAGLLAGAVGASFLVMAVFVGSAEDIGREIAAEVAPEVGREVGDGVADAMEDMAGSMLELGTMTQEESGWGSSGGPVQEHEPVEPGNLGPDPVLDQYAQDCFAGVLQSCDDLLYESPPLSAYEDYAYTCGGRVKPYDVMSCTDLE